MLKCAKLFWELNQSIANYIRSRVHFFSVSINNPFNYIFFSVPPALHRALGVLFDLGLPRLSL
jgi:hypothetical protein